MIPLSQAVLATGGRLAGDDIAFSGVSSDSRRIMPGNLFVALRGEHFDAYDFLADVAQGGAVAAMVNADSYEQHGERPVAGITLMIVDNTRLALGRLAGWWRKQFSIPVVAITGSNGKTTVKEMLAGVLREAAGSAESVLATRGNLNNDIGMPLTLLEMSDKHRYAVIEMGMNHPGEIDYLTGIASPDIALVNNASSAHLAGLGSVEAVARAKGEIFAGLQPRGTAVINADDEFAQLWRTLAGAHSLIEFGLDPEADVSGTWQSHGKGVRIDVTAPQGMFAADLQVPGIHNVRNALAATAAATVLNIPLETIASGLEKFNGVAGRMQRKRALQGALLIDDTYNANPASTRAAINVLKEQAGKRVLVLGDMGELGGEAASLHASIGEEARRAGIEKLLTLGTLSTAAAQAFGEGAQHFERIESLLSAVKQELGKDTTILVKGSRFMKMERVVQFCTGGGE